MLPSVNTIMSALDFFGGGFFPPVISGPSDGSVDDGAGSTPSPPVIRSANNSIMASKKIHLIVIFFDLEKTSNNGESDFKNIK